MKIAYIGPSFGTSLHREKALRRIGHEVIRIDPWSWLGNSKWVSRWLFFAGGVGTGLLIDKRINKEVKRFKPDLIFVNQGEFLGPNCLRLLKQIGVPIIDRINDDPFSGWGKIRFSQFLKSIQYYDLIVVPRKTNVSEAKMAGATRVVCTPLSADEIVHAPRQISDEEKLLFSSEVSFIGTWMPERGPFITELIHHKIPISIWGDRWQKAPEWKIIKPFWRGPGIYDEQTYSTIILASKICLGLLSKGNRDLHTSRSFEIPSLGSLFCGERTTEHMALYDDGVEAIFWNNADECAQKCQKLLANEEHRLEIAQNGHNRALLNNQYNEPMLKSIIALVMEENIL